MSIIRVNDNSGGVYLINNSDGPIEFVRFSEFRKRRYVEGSVATGYELIKREPKSSDFSESAIRATLLGKAESDWAELETEMRSKGFPNALKWTLSAPNKRRQKQQLKQCSFSADEFISFLFYAEDEGYLYSQYLAQHNHRGLNEDDLPELIDANTTPTRVVGETALTEGQLRQVISDRSVVVSTFLDKGDEWHCFFATYESLKGEENWQDGTPHFHYLSDKFGISREEAVRQLTSRKYHLGSLPHLKIDGYEAGQKSDESA